MLNALGDCAKDENLLLSNIIQKKQSNLYQTILYNLGYCCFKNYMLRESLKFVEMAHSINENSIKTQKLLGVLYDYYGLHKDAQFLYQNVILEVSKLSELKLSVKGRTLRGRNCQTLPPESINTLHTREYDIFCMKMIERSVILEKNKYDAEIAKESLKKGINFDKNTTSFNLKNTSLSFGD